MRRLLSVPSIVCLLALLAACGGGDSGGNPVTPTIPPQPFTITDLRAGAGAEALNGKSLTVNYAGWLYSQTAAENKGSLFDTSVGRSPYTFTLGANTVIRGWDQGLVGMKVGGVRRLVIPPELAYGATGNGPIPPNANLVFEVELLSVQ
jgi:FKBP-type peptidyl-prolyl cis-trans isomerase